MFGPYDKKFDKNKNGIMEDDEKLEEQAYIRYLAEMVKATYEAEEDDSRPKAADTSASSGISVSSGVEEIELEQID